jgi:N-methylhydantoinase A/oxoprolinase/acetone carboxylase beta subunit
MKQIGIDIGGTHTDAVLVDDERIIATEKVVTGARPEEGVVEACRKLLRTSGFDPSSLESIQIGTTLALNAILEGKELLRVGVIRMAPYCPALRCGARWPESLARAVIGGVEVVPGGSDLSGKSLAPFHKEKTQDAIRRLLDRGVEAFAITAIFSPLHDSQEREVRSVIEAIAGADFPVTLSSQIGGIGFLERENGAIINSALKKVMADGFRSIETAVASIGIGAPLFMVQNDGTILGIEQAIACPLLTISSGQTNSFRGARALAGVENLIVIDVGGTSCDIGIVKNGEPLRTLGRATLGGVTLFLPMSDCLSLPLGGGTRVREDSIGPDSVGRSLFQEAQCFGGETLTLTDIGVLLGHFAIQGAQKELVKMCPEKARFVLEQAERRVKEALFQLERYGDSLPLVIVGGAAALLKNLGGRIPDFAFCANGYGASLAHISAKKEELLPFHERAGALARMKEEVLAEAVRQGADPERVKIVHVQEIPCAYSQDGHSRFIVQAAGAKRRDGCRF